MSAPRHGGLSAHPVPPAGGTAATDALGAIADHLALLAAMAADFASTLDIEASLKRAVEIITRHLDAAGGALFLLEEEGRVLRCHACWGATEITGLTLKSDAGIVGRCVQSNRAEIVRDAASDPAFYKAVDARTGFTTRSILCAPMSVQDERIGAIELINKRTADGRFDVADLSLLSALSASAALAIKNARMAVALVEQERLKRELELAAEIQRSLLPAPQPPPFPIAGLNYPARTVSGDFFDFFALPDGRLYFNLGDVSGKGMNAALLMAKTASLFRALGKTVHSPGRLLGVINREIVETASRGMFVTMVGGLFDPASGRLVLANAGHEPPMLADAEGRFRTFPAAAPPLGIVGDLEDGFPEIELTLGREALYVFTDGVTEGYVDGRPMGVEGLQAALTQQRARPLVERLQAAVAPLRGRGALRDDITILGIERTDA